MMETDVKMLVAGLTLGTLIYGALQPAYAEYQISPARERAIRECMALQNRDPHDGYEGKKGGGLHWHYRACMADHGQPE
jgi:hypothetical protein